MLPRNTNITAGIIVSTECLGLDADHAQRRAGQLDAIRALCVIAVLFSHTISEAYRVGEYEFFEFGAYGVTMFFVLSGYLITGQLLATQDRRRAWGDGIGRPLARFYAKRMLRLFPAYYLALAVAAMLALPNIRAELHWHLLQLSDILFALDQNAEDTSAAGHLWSLTVEWQFYLVWPLALFLLPGRALPWAIGAMAAAGAYSWAPIVPLDPVIERTNILQSIDSLAFGAALALAAHRRRPLGWLAWAGWIGAGMFAVQVALLMAGHGRVGGWLAMPAHEGMNLAFAAITWRAASGFGGRTGALLELRPLRYIGLISYGIYVYHQFILALMERASRQLGLGALHYDAWLTVKLFLLSAAVAALSWHWVEAPINRLRAHLAYRRPPASGGALPRRIGAW
ncbi:acyltransferase family protein [Sphingomonas profundi]|uniref:acyltransferase family protein n=1 Tax=Alterirhizorhabdus profundi TaxID=2681549 RepID=UPI0018D11AFF|nr:acyltransferase [Sphingomonas profundi]